MQDKSTAPATIDAYIAGYPPHIQALLSQLRHTIRQAAPDAEERMSYQMPTFWQAGNLVHFAMWKAHIGFYPAPSGIREFAEEWAGYVTSKGAVHFPLDEPLPLALVTKVVELRLQENLEKAQAKRTTRSPRKTS